MATKNVALVSSTPVVSLREAADLIQHVATERTVIIQGHMGWGKTSILKTLRERTGNLPIYFDCVNNQIEDLKMPIMPDGHNSKCVRFVPSEELGMHLGVPIDLMFDEVGKNRGLIPPLMKLMLERTGMVEGSRVFGTTNLGSENVGDMLLPHQRNRLCIVQTRKPTPDEWKDDFAIGHDLDPSLIAGAMELPEFFQGFDEVEDPKENPYIYHPKDAARTAFVTGRSLHAASDILKKRQYLGHDLTMKALIGTMGAPAATKLMTYIEIGDTLPKYQQIVADPKGTPVPKNPAAQIMVGITCIQRVEQADFARAFEYMQRFPTEIQALFCTQLVKMKSKAVWVAQQSAFTEYARKNYGLFAPTK